jgi:hypothetical protein
MVDRVMIRPPSARVGPITPAERQALMAKSPVKGKYDEAVDSDSAYEMLQRRLHETGSTAAPAPTSGTREAEDPAEASARGGFWATILNWLGAIFGTNTRGKRLTSGQKIARNLTRSVGNQIAKDVEKSLGGKGAGSIGRAIVRGTMGGILRR